MIDIVTAARRHLVVDAGVIAVLGGSTAWPVWLFRWRSYVSVEGTGSVSAVLSQQGGWAAPNRHNTMSFPQLQVEIYADPTRTTARNPSAVDAHAAALDAHLALNALLHVPAGTTPSEGLVWGDETGSLRVLGSSLLGEPDLSEVPGGDGLVRSVARYGVVVA